MTLFGTDGLLYLSLGDGAEFDVNPQNLSTLQGSILRIDVDSGDPYAIPGGNPFTGEDESPEIWAYGFRNPWRFSIDGEENLMYVADVGQEDWEEVSVVSLDDPGRNFGWPIMEGNQCFLEPDCVPGDLVTPLLEYDHDEGCSVIGGFVYRGGVIPELQGHYFYADWCEGWIRSFRYADGEVTQARDWTEEIGELGQVASFGLDGAGETLVITSDNGTVNRIVRSG
jgi:glucose/arabinose dehydrogenase